MKKFLLGLLVAGILSVNTAQAQDMVKIGQDVVIGPDVTIDNVVAVASDIKMNGIVTGDAVAIFGDMTIGSSGEVHGSTVVLFGKLVKEPGAKLSNDAFEFSFGDVVHGKGWILPLIGLWAVGVGFVVMIGFGALFLLIAALFTGKVGKTSVYVENNLWRSLYYGFIILILLIPVTIFLVISIVGIPIVPLLFIVLSAATIFGYAVVCQLVGLYFFRYIKRPNQPMVLEVLIGFIFLTLISFVPVVGGIIKFAAWLVGLGATTATRFGTHTGAHAQ